MSLMFCKNKNQFSSNQLKKYSVLKSVRGQKKYGLNEFLKIEAKFEQTIFGLAERV